MDDIYRLTLGDYVIETQYDRAGAHHTVKRGDQIIGYADDLAKAKDICNAAIAA